MIGNAPFEILLLSVAGVVVQNLIFKRLSDQAALRELKKDNEHLMKEMKAAQKEKNTEKLEKAMNKINSLSLKRMSLTMKPNLISSIPFFVLIGWMKIQYSTLLVNLPFPIPWIVLKSPFIILRSTLGWFAWYFICVIAASFAIREFLEVEI